MSSDALLAAAASDAALVSPWLLRLAPERADAFALEVGSRAIAGTQRLETPHGSVAWRFLEWDSELLQQRCARLDALAPARADTVTDLVSALLVEWRARGVTHGIVRASANDMALHAACARHGLSVVDGIISLGCSLASALVERAPDTPRVRVATRDDAAAVAEIAAEVFHHDRFHSDSAIPKDRADALHRAWMHNTFQRLVPATPVWVIDDESGIVAFLSTTHDAATRHVLGAPVLIIELVGTAARGRRKGYAEALTWAAVTGARDLGYAAIGVGTQISNDAAVRVYERCGFRTSNVRLTWRWFVGEDRTAAST